MTLYSPFSLHLGPAPNNEAESLTRQQIAALQLLIDSDDLPAMDARGYRLVIGLDGELAEIRPINEPGNPGVEDVC